MSAVAWIIYGAFFLWRYIVDRNDQRERDEIKERLTQIENKLR
jgi:hypothetical protein